MEHKGMLGPTAIIKPTRNIETEWPENWTNIRPKCSQNCSQTVKLKLQNICTQLLSMLNKYNKLCFETAYLAENLKKLK